MANTAVSRTLSIYGVFSSNIVVNWSRLWMIARMTHHKSFKDFKLQSCPVFSNPHSFAPVIHDVTWWLFIMLKAWFIIRKKQNKNQLFLNNIGTAKNAVLIKVVINVTTGVSGASGSVGLIRFKMVKTNKTNRKKVWNSRMIVLRNKGNPGTGSNWMRKKKVGDVTNGYI